MSVPVAYQGNTSAAVADWLNKGDNAWQMIAATLVGLQSMPGLVILYGSIVKKKWAVNSAFMALYAFAAVWLCWVTWGYNMSFGHQLLPFWGKARPALGQKFLLMQAVLPESTHFFKDGSQETAWINPNYPMATMVYFQCVFAAITLILLAGSLLSIRDDHEAGGGGGCACTCTPSPLHLFDLLYFRSYLRPSYLVPNSSNISTELLAVSTDLLSVEYTILKLVIVNLLQNLLIYCRFHPLLKQRF